MNPSIITQLKVQNTQNLCLYVSCTTFSLLEPEPLKVPLHLVFSVCWVCLPPHLKHDFKCANITSERVRCKEIRRLSHCVCRCHVHELLQHDIKKHQKKKKQNRSSRISWLLISFLFLFFRWLPPSFCLTSAWHHPAFAQLLATATVTWSASVII